MIQAIFRTKATLSDIAVAGRVKAAAKKND